MATHALIMNDSGTLPSIHSLIVKAFDLLQYPIVDNLQINLSL